MFTPKSFNDILAEMVAYTRACTDRLTDFNVGGVTRSWYEAIALVLSDLWLETAHGIDGGIAEAVYLAYGFERLPSQYALGEVTFYLDAVRTEDVIIATGTRVRQLGGVIEYITVEEGVIPAGQLEDTVMVRSVNSGPESNVDVGTLTIVVDGEGGLFVINRYPIQNGRNEETDAERAARFAEYIQTLARGTVSALHYAARLAYIEGADGVIEKVVHVAMKEVPGTVWLYIHNGNRNTSAALIQKVQTIIDGEADYLTGNITPGWRAAGVEVIVLPMTELPVNVVAYIKTTPGTLLTDIQAAAEVALDSLLRNFQGTVLTVPQLLTTLYTINGVLDIVIGSPTTAKSVEIGQRLVFNSVTLNSWDEALNNSNPLYCGMAA